MSKQQTHNGGLLFQAISRNDLYLLTEIGLAQHVLGIHLISSLPDRSYVWDFINPECAAEQRVC